MADQLTLKEVFSQPDWASVVQAYQQCSQYDRFERLFERPKGIHGVHHARRVLFHTLVLCKLCNIDVQEQTSLSMKSRLKSSDGYMRNSLMVKGLAGLLELWN